MQGAIAERRKGAKYISLAQRRRDYKFIVAAE